MFTKRRRNLAFRQITPPSFTGREARGYTTPWGNPGRLRGGPTHRFYPPDRPFGASIETHLKVLSLSNLPSISIDSIEIRQDDAGRFCLNDLHKAAGGLQKHKPVHWLANAQTVELVGELEKVGNPTFTVRGRNGGTYVVKPLVYAYAMWISPKFHLKVIETFDAVVQGRHQPQPSTLGEILSTMVEGYMLHERQIAEINTTLVDHRRKMDILRDATRLLGDITRKQHSVELAVPEPTCQRKTRAGKSRPKGLMTSREAASHLRMTAQELHATLEGDLLVSTLRYGRRVYQLTEKGARYGYMTDTDGQVSTRVFATKAVVWKPDVIDYMVARRRAMN